MPFTGPGCWVLTVPFTGSGCWVLILTYSFQILVSSRKKKLMLAPKTHFGSDVIVQNSPAPWSLLCYPNRIMYVTEYMWQWGEGDGALQFAILGEHEMWLCDLAVVSTGTDGTSTDRELALHRIPTLCSAGAGQGLIWWGWERKTLCIIVLQGGHLRPGSAVIPGLPCRTGSLSPLSPQQFGRVCVTWAPFASVHSTNSNECSCLAVPYLGP